MTIPPEAIPQHAADCPWEQADCEWKATHHYCPHPEHLCNCHRAAQARFSQRKHERAAYEYGFKEGAAAERDRIAVTIAELRTRAQRLAKLTGDGAMSIGYHAQDEVLAAVANLLGEP